MDLLEHVRDLRLNMQPHPRIRAALQLALGIILISGCDSGDHAQMPKKDESKSPPAATESDITGVWKCVKYSNPKDDLLPPSAIDDWLSITIEFKADHTTVTHSSYGETPGTWSLTGVTVTSTLAPVGNLPPMATPMNWDKGMLVEMSGNIAFSYEKQKAKTGNTP